jgi:lysozyme family protein
MQTGFSAAMALVFQHEGGFVDHPLDPGGATNLGITRATLERVRGHPVATSELMALTRDEAAGIYRRLYWDAVAGDALPDGLDLCVFDYAVNSGPDRAARDLQRVLGVAVDRIVGPITLAAAARADRAATIEALTMRRLGFLGRLPTFGIFGRGWRARVADTRNAALARAASSSPQKQEPSMDTTKSVFASRTVWANLIGLVSVGLTIFGFDTKGVDAGNLADAVLQIVTAGSLIASTAFRVIASKKIA